MEIRQQRTLTGVRFAAVALGIVQVATFYRPYAPGTQAVAWTALAILLITTLTVYFGASRATTLVHGRRWALAGLLSDFLAAMVLVFAYTFDPETAVWALLYLVLVEAAILFGFRGGMIMLGVCTIAYLGREIYGAIEWDTPFLAVSISFRMGIGGIMASAAGLTANRMREERDRLRRAMAVSEQRGRELNDANKALQSARKAQLEFVSVTNHELRTPLTAIKGFSRTLILRWKDMDDSAKRAAVQAIDQQSIRLAELVEDVLTVSSMHSGELALSPRPLHLRTWFEEAVALSEVEATIVCPGDILVQADSTRLLQILVNLLSNARKYGRPPVTLIGGSYGEQIRITVHDHGDGVPVEFEPRMWDEFSQASVGETRTADGYGLGLSIVRYLTLALGGKIDYETLREGGGLFTVELPTGTPADAPDIAPQVSSLDPVSAEGHGPRRPELDTPEK